MRTYLDAKHRRLGDRPGIRHSLLIPGAHLSEHDGIYKVPAPALPFGKGYRFPPFAWPPLAQCPARSTARSD
nr:hypothetical protein GCM10020185_52160 [Pseudomonas brassicacearum subsp. brassicacearum]